MKKNTTFLFITCLLFVPFNSSNVTVSTIAENQSRSQHKMAEFWKFHFILSPIGIFFNGVVLYLFVDERKSLIKSINVMLW